jgi:hypothetical protein
MNLVSNQEVEDLIRLARSRAVDKRLISYTQQQAWETIGALHELQANPKLWKPLPKKNTR